MTGFIDGFDFKEMEIMKYYAPPASKDPAEAKQEAMDKVYSGLWYGARKMDGVFSKFVKDEDGNMMLLMRNRNKDGVFLDKIEYVPQFQSFFNTLPNGTCLLSEIYFPTHEGSSEVTKILGCKLDKALERQNKGDKLNLYIFDVLAWDEQSFMNKRFIDRISYLNELSSDNTYIHFAEYLNGSALWDMIQETLQNGGEGAVITEQSAKYQPGKRSKKITLKIKKEVSNTLDVFVIDKLPPARLSGTTAPETWMYWENTKTGEKYKGNMYKEYSTGDCIEPVTKGYYYDWAGSLVFGAVNKDNKVIPVCSISGFTEEVLSNYEKYKGVVAEITAMEVLDTGGLRHPKFVRWHADKQPKDCKWEDIFG